ncbi:MAG TPA: DUF2339 domain-containing protein [Pyrinomonadaceae bacterium]|nr:DUF2339 domain-containing protein [Pyrinomonadaceae bacterium]
MDEFLILILLLLIAAILCAIVLPIIALVISIRSRQKLTETISKLQAAQSPLIRAGSVQPSPMSGEAPLVEAFEQLKLRIEKLEAVTTGGFDPHRSAVDAIGEPEAEQTTETPGARPPSPPISPQATDDRSTGAQLPPRLPPPVVPMSPFSAPGRAIHAAQIESIIGRRLVGWAAVGLILFATAFFLKYAFDNRWIGELGRVAIGVVAGVTMTVFGFKYHRRGWRIFSQILTGGGVVLLYLSVYAAFGYYHLATQKAAFLFLAILIAEAALLALIYNAPAIAFMALIGGFLTPLLLHSDRDQYASLFAYIAALDLGALALLKRWRGLSSLAFAGTHLLFWLWYDGHYHPRKLGAVLLFQTSVLLMFLLAHVGRQIVQRRSATLEDLALLVINPFVFFATAYHLLNADHHDWMGVFAIGMALLYAGTAKILSDRSAATRGEALTLIGVALTFVTIAIPIQLQSNWITIAWSVEALVMLWAGIETRSERLRVMAYTLFSLALVRLVFWDTPGEARPLFTPVLNKYFLSSVVVCGCLFAAAQVYQKAGQRRQISPPQVAIVISLVAIVTLWLVLSVETYTFFAARAASRRLAEDASHERWLGQMALSVLWSLYAATLAAVGFVRRSPAVRWAGLVLFGITVIKVMLIDIAQLEQLYRIIVFLVLGMLLLVVTWGYHKAFHSQESQK